MCDSREIFRPDRLKRPRLATRTQANDSERYLTTERPPDVDIERTGSEDSVQAGQPPSPNGGTIRPGYFANASRKYRGRKKAEVEEIKTENARLKTETERLRLELTNCRESPSDSHGAVLKEILSLLRKQNDWIEQMMDTTLWVYQSKNEQEPLTAVVHDSDEPVVGVAQSPSPNSFFDTGEIDIDANISPEFLDLLDKAMGLP